jgi:outer membrane protein, heavy metal efflux system
VFLRPSPLLVLVAALPACVAVAPLDDMDPAPLLGSAAGVAASIEFRTDAEPDDAGVSHPGLTLADAVREALTHDPRVQQALARWHRARAESEEARLLPNPVLSVSVLLAKAISDAQVTVGIAQEVAAYLQRPHKADAADARLRAAAEESFVAALEAVAETRAAYLVAQDAEARRPLVSQRLDILTRLRDIHRESLREREGLPSDVTALDAEVASVDLDLAELDADRARSRIDLARLIGRPSDPGAWTLDAWPALQPPPGDAASWIRRALVRRPEIRAIGWELVALGADRELAATWPWDGAAAGAEAEYDEGLAVGPTVELPLPIFDQGAPRDAALAAAQTELRHKAVEVRRAVIRDVRLALADEAAARRALDLLEKGLLPLLERRRGEIDAAKKAGEVEITILLLADRELQEARARRVELERRVLDARIRLERAAGGPTDVPPPPAPKKSADEGVRR